MFLIAGLGNPGTEYANTRHNIGFMVADCIASQYRFLSKKIKFHSEVSEGIIDGQKIMLIKPMSYMNRSGGCVAEAARFFKIPIENIIVIHDDLDLKIGKVRVKAGGGNGGHNGLRDIDARLGKEYTRIRIGIGHPGDRDMVTDYVLQKFSRPDMEIMHNVIESAAGHMDILLQGKRDLFMTHTNQCNS